MSAGESAQPADELLQMIREQPCADVGQAMLRQVQQPGAAIVFVGVPDVVDLLRDEKVGQALLLAG
ncbi:hypothetical protein [Actinoplanes sp. HUAS TT8]|uniref:hypothetical protein n=1 Tax=Actinoplanes sp. HUAS TT8 TaxID=3447453 RepID=UPI003F521518